MRIALDLDMTLNTMAYTWIKWLKANIDDNITLSHVRYHGFIRDAYGKVADAYWKDPACYDEITLLDGASDFLAWAQSKYECIIITHTPPGQQSEIKDAWIAKHIGDIKVIHTDQKHRHSQGCMLIDDHPGHIQRHVRHNENCHGIVFNHQGRYGWAHALTCHPRVDTACTYDQLKIIISHWDK